MVNGDLRVTGTIYGTHTGNYGTCNTAAATQEKVVSIQGFSLATGVHVCVKFITNTNSHATPTLNVSSTGAKSIKYRGGNLPSAGTLAAGRVYEFRYDGTNWELVGDLDTNTQTVTGVKGNSESSYRTGNVNITAANIGLGNVNNTSDADKPVSTATQTALDGKVNKNTLIYTTSTSPSTGEYHDWNSLTDTGIYELRGDTYGDGSADKAPNRPESSRMTLVVINSDGYVRQLALGNNLYTREKISGTSGTWDDWETLESQANKVTAIREFASASDDKYPSEKAVAYKLSGLEVKPILHAEGYFNRQGVTTTWTKVGMYRNDRDTPIAYPSIYGPSGDKDGRLTGSLDSIVTLTGWEPYESGCMDFTIIFDSSTSSTQDVPFKLNRIIDQGIRKFKIRFFNYGTGTMRARFCYDYTDSGGGTYLSGVSIYTQEGKNVLNYYQVDVPPDRYAEVDVLIPTTVHDTTSTWVAIMNVTYGVS